MGRPAHRQMTSGFLLSRLGQEATARYRQALRPLGLTAQTFAVLKVAEALGPCSQQDLGSALGIDTSNLASVVAQMVERGLVSRERDAANRRRYVLRLEGPGRDLLAQGLEAAAEGEREMLSPLTEEERAQLFTLLSRVAATAHADPLLRGEAEPAAQS